MLPCVPVALRSARIGAAVHSALYGWGLARSSRAGPGLATRRSFQSRRRVHGINRRLFHFHGPRNNGGIVRR